MKNELTKTQAGQIALLDQQALSDIIKPLSQEIHLFDSYVSGTLNVPAEVIKDLKEGQKLVLQREASKFDANTVNIYTEDQIKIGMIPEKDNVVFARLMDAGKLLIARIREISYRGSLPMIGVGIYLVDY